MIKYKIVNSIEYNEDLTEYTVLKTTKRWWGYWNEEYVTVYRLKDHIYPLYRDGSSAGREVYYAIHDYKIACEIEACLSI